MEKSSNNISIFNTFLYLIFTVVVFIILIVKRLQNYAKFYHPRPEIQVERIYFKPVDDVYYQLVDLVDFKFLTNFQVCDDCKDFLMVVLISSALKNTQNRAAIRETWGKQWNCVKVAYLVGTTEDPELIQMIQEENDEHRDVIQGNFVDSYRNLTYKHVMALKWVAYYCPKAKYVVKTDDDLVVNTTRLYEVLKAKTFGERNLIACGVRHLGPVMRKKDLKWFVTREEYHEDYYPDYCTGAFIIYSADVARRLLAASRKVRPFWIDDVYVSGILAKVIGVTHVQIKTDEWYTRKTEMMKAGLKQLNNKIYGPLSLKPEKIREIWKTKLDGGNEISWDMHEILIEYLMSSERTYMS